MGLKRVLQGRFMAHPLHPALVHVPIGLWFGSFIFDIIGRAQSDPNLGHALVIASYFTILLGVIAAVPTAITGLAEYVDVPRGTETKTIATTHMLLNVGVVVAYIVQLVIRDTTMPAVETGAFVLNIVQIVALSISGYLGGKMVFERRVGSRVPEAIVEEREKQERVA